MEDELPDEAAIERVVIAVLGPDPDLVPVAAVGLTRAAWRDTAVENAHASNGLGRISDAEMFAANAATTRLVLSYLADDPIDWSGLADDLVRTDRLAGPRSVEDLLGELYECWAEEARAIVELREELSTTRGRRWVLLMNALYARETDWWGMPSWPAKVERFLSELGHDCPASTTTEKLASLLVQEPDRASLEILDWCLTHGLSYA